MLAAAKINLDLRITGRRDDGYHLLDSIVVFTEYGDQLEAEICDQLSLEISGPFGDALTSGNNNLILKASALLCEEAGVEPTVKFHLTKNLPVSSGIGGGSADAAAAMILTRDLLKIVLNEERFLKIALTLGADVPVCLRSKPTRMRGIGGDLENIVFADDLYLLLVNPRISVSTPAVFKQYLETSEKFDQERKMPSNEIHLPLMIDLLKDSHNSLEDAACTTEPCVSKVLTVLSETEGVLLSRMSGSGATCFGLYESKEQCERAAKKLRMNKNDWWIRQTRIKD